MEILTNNMDVFFSGEKPPMKIKAINSRFAICTRNLHRRYDADLLKHKVDMGAYISFTQAYEDLKNEKVYTIIDFERKIRAPHNLIFGGYDISEQNDIEKLLKDLESNETQLSERNKCEYILDTDRTFKLSK